MSRIGNDNRFVCRQILRVIPLGLSGVLTLSGCATWSREECLTGDWYEIGVRDGAAGSPFERLDEYWQACSEYRVRPDRAAYRAGWAEGIRNYCTPERGFHEGRQGASYAQVCPPGLERAFLREYWIGQEGYEQDRRIRELERERERRREEHRNREEHPRSGDRHEPPERSERPERPERPEYSSRRTIQPVGQPILLQPHPSNPPVQSVDQESLREEMRKTKENRLHEPPKSRDVIELAPR